MGTAIPYGYIYKTTLPSGKFYIGQHKGQKFDKHYVGSGVIIRDYLKTHPRELLSVEILDWADNIEELNKKESFYVSKVLGTSKNLNLRNGGNQAGYTKETLLKIRERSTGPKTEEGKQRIAESNRRRFLGKHRTNETKEKLRKANLGKKYQKNRREKIEKNI